MAAITDVSAWMPSRTTTDVMLGTGVNLLVHPLCGEDLTWSCPPCNEDLSCLSTYVLPQF